MFSLSYFWTYIFANMFSFFMLRHYKNFGGSSELVRDIYGLVGSLTYIAEIVFIVLGFWFMPAWYYPIVFILIGMIFPTLMPLIPDIIPATIGLIASPILVVFSYIYLFR